MVEISLENLSLFIVFAAYGSFHIGTDFFNWLSAKKWYMPVLVVVLMIVGFFVCKGVYGK